MKSIKLALLATAITASSYAMADDDMAINLMALNASNTSVEMLSPTVRQAHSGVVTEIELDDYKDQQVVYEFKIINLEANNKHKLSYSVNDQSLLKEESESLSTFGFSDLDKDERLAIERVNESGFDILNVIPTLEDKYSAKLIEAELEEKNGFVFYEIKLASAEAGKQKLLINVDSGEEIPVLKRHKK
ncbi:lipoprotein [Vibrio astriarenae]|nr:lipoprotein [Vibrio sp. C7]